MKAVTAFALAAGLITATSALHLVKRGTSSVINLPTRRKTVQNPAERDSIRRRKTVTESFDNEQTLYFANVSLGTPAQNLRLQIDTGSSDLWANANSAQICSYGGDHCSDLGTYDANSSSTYEYVSNQFNVSYIDGSGASGDYATDTLSIGGKTLEALQFGIGYRSKSLSGILGIGYTANEAQVDRVGQKVYSNVPQAMVDGGLIQSNAYSLWLDDLEASTGSILFGGVDTDKYHGQLQTLPVQKTFDEYAEFIITLTSMSLNIQGRKTSMTAELPTAVILDSGSSLTYLPEDLTKAIYDALHVTYNSREGAGYASCSLADEEITLDFAFTSPTISVSISELIINGDASNSGDRQDADPQKGGSSPNFVTGSEQCIFGIAPSEGSYAVLGDTFLRSAYVVYDLANNEISLAQTDFNATDSHISEISTGTDSVPDATPVLSAIQAQASQTRDIRIAGVSGTSTGSLGPALTGKSGALTTHITYGGLASAVVTALAAVCA
jgi:hypothetical protein